jgi:hypothetical protein
MLLEAQMTGTELFWTINDLEYFFSGSPPPSWTTSASFFMPFTIMCDARGSLSLCVFHMPYFFGTVLVAEK